nr:MAG TPA: hypothetical protein [Caudoviricetes sp.]
MSSIFIGSPPFLYFHYTTPTHKKKSLGFLIPGFYSCYP